MKNPFADVIWLHELTWGKQNFIDLGHGKFLSIVLEYGHMADHPITHKVSIKKDPQYIKLNCALQAEGENLEFREFTELDEFLEYMNTHSAIRQGIESY